MVRELFTIQIKIFILTVVKSTKRKRPVLNKRTMINDLSIGHHNYILERIKHIRRGLYRIL